MRVGVDGVCNVGVSVVTRGHIRHCRSTFGVGAQWHVTDVPNTKDEMHVVGPLAPEFELTHAFPPLLEEQLGHLWLNRQSNHLHPVTLLKSWQIGDSEVLPNCFLLFLLPPLL